MTKVESNFIKMANGQRTQITPIWIMRQAGRYLPEYRKIRKTYSFLEMCLTPELAMEVTLQPLRRFEVDAAILFSDILILPRAMGMHLDVIESKGPVFSNPISSRDDIDKLHAIHPQDHLNFTLDAIKLIIKEENRPLIGFAGAPFTVACYMLEGMHSKNFNKIKTLLYTHTNDFNLLMEKLTTATIDYLHAQIDSGVSAVQLFDTWSSSLNKRDYDNYVFPWVKKIFDSLKGHVPTIYYINHSSHLLQSMADCNSDIIGLDWRYDIAPTIRELKKIKPSVIIQGNFDPCKLFASQDLIEKEARNIIENSKMADGHIFNLGHGILPTTPIDNVKCLIDTVHGLE